MMVDGRPTAVAPSHEEFERIASQPLLCYNCGLECDLTRSREHLEEALALHKEVRTYKERVASIEDLTISRPLVQIERAIPIKENSGFEVEELAPPAGADMALAQDESAGAALYHYRATFLKGDEVKYLSHLDLTRGLPRAFRRAGIRLGYSQGFHPMPLIQYGPALGVGVVGENELLDFDAHDDLEEANFLSRINVVLPAGLRFNSLDRLSAGAQSLIKVVDRAEYSISLDLPEIVRAVARLAELRDDLVVLDLDMVHQRVTDEFMARESFVIERIRKDKRQRVDVRRYTIEIAFIRESNSLRVVTEISPNGGVKPTEVLAAVYGLNGGEVLALSSRVRRLRLYAQTAPEIRAGQLSEPSSEALNVFAGD
jgi:radical SAM-linked protein